ncbi:hypothetical protein P175DRAFT_0500737 [Aspergillus ochraceoroseus IBT 24754]|uniref:Uncharacterized protein n=1 Tax=Aspergillus ochraceoroseus IBT 24754 TaxID=1392256 RepID=A0A2T5M000_9EURO|nr:uncharacterized protein P175DRAFT_0500737 [Aspergillus ochraceoroseus IBT 24754]PTU21858.1 hypothetical protein P175DRAFT_0500737 [Aspergillus ochraceoroseus IBT 24754]
MYASGPSGVRVPGMVCVCVSLTRYACLACNYRNRVVRVRPKCEYQESRSPMRGLETCGVGCLRNNHTNQIQNNIRAKRKLEGHYEIPRVKFKL